MAAKASMGLTFIRQGSSVPEYYQTRFHEPSYFKGYYPRMCERVIISGVMLVQCDYIEDGHVKGSKTSFDEDLAQAWERLNS